MDIKVVREILRDITPGPEVVAAQAALNEALDGADRPPACRDRYREFKDYRTSPTAYQAKRMCSGCPIVGTGLCLALGVAERADAKRRTGENIQGVYESVAIEHYRG